MRPLPKAAAARSVALGYERSDYDRLVLPAGQEGEEIADSAAAEGAVSRILYAAPEGLSSLQVHRNYQTALREAGFQVSRECLDACEPIGEWVYGDGQGLDNYDPAWMAEEPAAAVVEHLTAEEGFAADRLEPHGVGPLAPAGTNETEEGRARNRRVELVKLP